MIIKITYLRLFRYFPADLPFIFMSVIHFELIFVRTVQSVSSITGHLAVLHCPVQDAFFSLSILCFPAHIT